jgi:midasin
LWEETAARHVTLGELLKPLVSIASHWRKLELDGWKAMLIKARDDVKKEAWEAWFFLFGIVKEDIVSISEFVNAIDSFIQSSSLGQFQERIEILRMFSAYLSDEKGIERALGLSPRPSRPSPPRATASERDLCFVLGNLARYYAQFQPAIEEHLEGFMKPLEKELGDFVRLAKWEDRGFYAMRASAEKAHTQLCKISRKAKDALGAPSTACLRVQAQNIQIPDSADSAEKLNQSDTLRKLEDVERRLKAVDVRVVPMERQVSVNEDQKKSAVPLGKYSQRLHEIAPIFERMLQDKSRTLEEVRSFVRNIDGLASTAVGHAATLRDDASRGAKARKKKALSDFFKALEACGISKLQNAIPLEARNPHHWMTVDCEGVSDDRYYYESVARLTRLREVSQKPHEDIQSREVHMCGNMVTHMLYMLQEIRSAASKGASALRGLEDLDGLSLGRFGSFDSFVSLQDAISSCLAECSSCEEWARGVLVGGERGDDPLHRAMVDTLGRWTQMLRRSQDTLMLARGRKNWVSCGMEAAIRECREEAMSPAFVGGVGTRWENVDAARNVLHSQQRLVDAFNAIDHHQEQREGSFSWSMFAEAYETALRSCMVWAQGTKDRVRGQSWAIVPDVVDASRGLDAVLENITSLMNIAQGFRVHENSEEEKEEEGCRAEPLLARLGLFVDAVRRQTEVSLAHIELLHRALAKLCYITGGIFCNLVEHGFCVAEEKEGMDTEREEDMDGTGLGDGDTTGAKDISNELEDQDQLLNDSRGQEKDLNGENNDADEGAEDQTHGVEMDDDFDGREEDVEMRPDEDDRDDEEEDDDDDRLDQQMGEADGADPVDEKAWDGQEDDEDRKADDTGEHQRTGHEDEFAMMAGEREDEEKHNDEGTEDEHNEDEDKNNREENDEEGYDGEYEENVDTGLLDQQEPIDEPMELPDDLQLEDDEKNNDKNDENDENDENDGGLSDGGAAADEPSSDDVQLGDDEKNNDGNVSDGGDAAAEPSSDDVQLGDDEKNNDDNVSDGGNVADEPDDRPGTGEGQGVAHTAHASGDTNSNQMDDENVDGNVDGNVQGGERGEDDLGGTAGVEGGAPIDGTSTQGREANNKELDGSDSRANPFRSVESAAERWQKKNAIDVEERHGGDDGLGDDREDAHADEHTGGYRFVRKDDVENPRSEKVENQDDLVMADATDEQAAHAVDHDEEEETRRDIPEESPLETMETQQQETQEERQAKKKGDGRLENVENDGESGGGRTAQTGEGDDRPRGSAASFSLRVPRSAHIIVSIGRLRKDAASGAARGDASSSKPLRMRRISCSYYC